MSTSIFLRPSLCAPGNAALGRRPTTQRCLDDLVAISSALRARRLVERGAQSLRKLYGVVVRPEVQEEQPRLLVEHVAVNCRHLDAIRSQRLDHRIDLVSRQYEISGDGGLSAAGGLEVDGRRQSERTGGAALHSALTDLVGA